MRTRTARTAATGLALAALVIGPGAVTYGSTATPDLVAPQESTDGVEVSTYGVITVRATQNTSNPPVTMALHGVQRVEGGTVVYYSAGQAEAGEVFPLALSDIRDPTRGSTTSFGSVRITDVAGGKAYRTMTLPNPGGGFYTPFASVSGAYPAGQPGTMGVLYAVLPELPPETEAVNVELLNGQTIADVPVGDGYLEPTTTSAPDEVVPLGSGWPEIDESQLGQVDPAAWTYPLVSTVELLDESQTITTEEKTVTIDLQADVLFAFDRAELNPAAQATLARITQKLTADGATGTVQIIGHTDSQGSDAYNVDLSKRRAQSVAAVLQPGLAGLEVAFAVEGRGEAEPIASNTTPDGQQLNRRVSIVYTTGGS